MHRNLESTSELTEFAPLSPEERSGFGLLGFSKFFKLGKGDSPEPGKENNTGNNQLEKDWQASGSVKPSESDTSSNLQYSIAINEGRSLPNVLKRISNLVALKNVGLTSYKNTDLKQYWMPDSFSKECYDCGEKFTTFRRRHHCRVCGQIFCSKCCNQEIPGKIMGCTGDLRVCTYCCKVVLSYLQSADIGANLSADLRALQEDLQTKFGNNIVKNTENFQTGNVSSSICEKGETSSNTRRKPSVGYQEEIFVMGRTQSPSYLSEEERCRALQNSASLRSLYKEILRPPDGIILQSHRYRLRSFSNCFFGSELVDWLIARNKAGTRVQGVAMGQALLEAGYLEAVSDINFVDGLSLYRPVSLVTLSNSEASNPNDPQEPLWVKEISQQDSTESLEPNTSLLQDVESESISKSNSNYLLNINVKENIVHVSRPSPPLQDVIQSVEKNSGKQPETLQEKINFHKEANNVVLNTDWDKTSTVLPQIDGEDPCHKNLCSDFEHHKQSLLRQMLNTEGLSQSWSDPVQEAVSGIVDLVHPDMMNDEDAMDIRFYVQVKKLPGGHRNDSSIIPGIVCSKNIAHRSMRSVISNPRILLLRCSVAYERIEGRLLTLEPVIMQEHEYLRHVVARIAALQPDIVMVYRNVSRLAQEYLLKLGITLIINTKLSILERVSRFTQADVVTSVDAHISKPQLGTCKMFYLKSYPTENGDVKTLMFFEGSSNPSLGCSLLLRGGTSVELKKLKKIVLFMIFACYNWKLEKSFLMDEFAKPPTIPFLLLVDSPETDMKLSEIPPGNKVETKVKIEKEDKKVMVETVKDCSDPLQSYLNRLDDSVPKHVEGSPVEQFSVAELPFSNKFRKSLDDTILSVSLYVKYSVPYLETETGRNCILRRYFPKDIYYSKQFLNKSDLNRSVTSVEHSEGNNFESQLNGVKLLPKHPFVLAKMTDTVNSVEVQTLLALFRANGGRIPLTISEMEKKEMPENFKNQVKSVRKKVEKLDVLDPDNHQRLPVLFCSYCFTSQNFPAFCVDPWVVDMYFYGTYDIPLGSFLERYCFRTSYDCPSDTCNTPMLEHVRRFVHDPGCVHLTLSRLEEFDSKQMLMWSWCPKCQSGTPMVPVSSNTWTLSFAKYLELKFRGHVYTRRDTETCKHSLHHDHFQYFGMNKIVALFKFSTIRIWEICLSPSVISVQFEMTSQNVIMDELRNLAIKGHDIFSLVLEKLHSLEGSEEDIQSMKHQQQKEQANFKAKIEEIQLKLTTPTVEDKKPDGNKLKKETEAVMWHIEDSVIDLKRLISEAVIGWNARFQEAVNAPKKKDDKEKEKVKRPSESSRQSSQASVLQGSHEIEDKDEDFVEDAPLDNTNSSFRHLSDNIVDSMDVDSDDNTSTRHSASDISDHDRGSEEVKEKKPQTEAVVNSDESQIDSKYDKKSVKNILSHILTSNKDFVPIQSPWNPQEHYLLPPGPNATVMVHENEPSSIISYALASYDYQRYLEEIQHKKLHLSSSSEGPIPSPINRRKTLSFTSNSEKEAEGPDSRRSTVLSFLRGNNQPAAAQISAKVISTEGTHHCLNSSSVPEGGTPNPNDQDEKGEDCLKKNSKVYSSSHIEIMFSDSSTNFYCRIYFAEQFAALRQTVFPQGEEAFVRSLSRCVQWAARGGKSGSTFCKTKDDRFVLKEMSKLELQLFSDFAIHYFSYIQKCQESNQPTLLGKIVGVYTVSFRNTTSNSTLKCNLLVMENLFYKKNVAQKYDLKGSVRNRLVNPSLQTEGEIVYLDENLLQMTTDSPLYILSHSQAVLMKAIESDTQFLAAQTVMDYSLLVGLDEDRRELVVGIIDYIRTFTWDKKLETMVKKSGIMLGQGKQPTVIQPKDYRDRFIAAMHRYFLPVPDRILSRYKLDDFGLNSEYREKIFESSRSRLSSKKSSPECDIVPKHWTIVSEGFPPGVTVDEIKKYGRRRQLTHLRPSDNLRVEEGSLKPFKSEYKRRFLAHGLPKVSELSGQSSEGTEGKEDNLILKNCDVNFLLGRPTLRKPQNNLFLPKDYPMESLTEKNSKYIPFPNFEKRKLLRRSTALRPEGEVARETEVRREYKGYQNPERAQLIRKLPSLKLEGEFETLTTEQKDKFIAFLLGQRPILVKKKTSLKLEGDFDFLTEKKLNYIPHEFSKRPIIRKRSSSLKLDGGVEFFPEYRHSFVDFPRTRPITYKPNGNIINEGKFEDRTETKTQFVGFENISIPESVKPENNLHVEGEMEISPEYKINFIDFPRERPFLRRPLNHLNPERNLQILTENSERFCETEGLSRAENSRRPSNLRLEGDFSFLSENSEKFTRHEIPDKVEDQKKFDPDLKLEDFTTEKAERLSHLTPDKTVAGKRPSSLKLDGEFPFPSELSSSLDFRKSKTLTPVKDIKSNPPSPKKKPKGKMKLNFDKEEKSNTGTFKRSNLRRQNESSPEKILQFEVSKNTTILGGVNKRQIPQFKPPHQFQGIPPADVLQPPKEFSAFKVLDVKGQVGCQSIRKDFLDSEKSTSDEENPTYRLEVSNTGEESADYYSHERRALPSLTVGRKERAENYVKVVKRPQIPNYLSDERVQEKENRWKVAEKLRPLSPQESLDKLAFVVLDEGQGLCGNPSGSPKNMAKRERGDWMSDLPSLLPA